MNTYEVTMMYDGHLKSVKVKATSKSNAQEMVEHLAWFNSAFEYRFLYVKEL